MLYAKFVRERETKNTIRFEEIPGTDEDGNTVDEVIGKLYIKKAALENADLGNVQVLEVAVQSAD